MSHTGLKPTTEYTNSLARDMTIGVSILNYSAGEPQLSLSKQFLRIIGNTGLFDARCLGKDYCNVMLLAQASDILQHAMPDAQITLYLPYMPFSRQDRRVKHNTASSLKLFAQMVNSMFFSYVKTIDAHSDVCEAVFDNLANLANTRVVQEAMKLHAGESLIFLSPDAGAAKKMPDLIKSLDLTGIEVDAEYAQKHRDVMTGEITHTSVPSGLDGGDIMIVDDICDGGRTFIEIAKALPNDTTKHLVVTHGIFSKGVDVLFEHFASVTTTDSFPQTDNRVGVINV